MIDDNNDNEDIILKPNDHDPDEIEIVSDEAIEISPEKSNSFGDNLAEDMDDMALSQLASDMLDLIRSDREARKKRDELYKDTLKKTFLAEDKEAGAPFQGASKVNSPLITQACIDYLSRTSKELLPPDGPARMKVLGKVTKDKLERAERERDFINLQAMDIQSEYKNVLEKVLSQVPLSGSVYIKHLWNFNKNTFKIEPVYIDDMILPYHASSFIEARRKTQRMFLSKDEIAVRVKNGLYREVGDEEQGAFSGSSSALQLTKSEQIANKIEGKQEGSNEDGVREVYECHWRYTIESDELAKGEERPYIITIDAANRNILSIYRNWDEEDEFANEIQWFVEYLYFPWRGVYGASIYQIAGGLTISATGALRALLDSAHIQNFPAGLKLRGNKFSGQSISMEPLGVTEIDASANITDIRQIFMPLPFNPPSTVLFQLYQEVTSQAQQLIATAEEKIADVGNQAPVGTALALIEQGSKTYASIFGRAHFSQAQSLDIIYRLNKKYLDRDRVKNEYGEDLLKDGDFEGICNVMPVSDPNIFAETQRYAQLQAVLQLANQAGDVFNRRELIKRGLVLLRVPAPDELLIDEQKPKITNAAAENVAISLGRPVVAFVEQDHMAHIHTHMDYAKSSIIRQNQLLAQASLPMISSHISEHMAYAYNQLMYEKTNELLRKSTGNPKADIGEILKIKDEDVIQQSDHYIADVSQIVSKEIEEIFAPVLKEFAEIQQFMQSIQQPPQPTPDVLVAQAQMQEVQRKAQEDQTQAQIAQQKVQADQEKAMAEIQLQLQELQRKAQKDAQEKDTADAKLILDKQEAEQRNATEQMRIQADILKNEQDNQTVLAAQSVKASEQGGQITSGDYFTNPRPRP